VKSIWIKKLFFLIVIVLISSSCTKFKYEQNQIIGGWRIINYTANGIDSTAYFEQFKYQSFSLTKEGQIYIAYISTDTSFSSVYAYGDWKLSSRNEIINFDMKKAHDNQCLKILPLYPRSNTAWKILKLDQNNFEIRTIINDKIYKLNLESID